MNRLLLKGINGINSINSIRIHSNVNGCVYRTIVSSNTRGIGNSISTNSIYNSSNSSNPRQGSLPTPVLHYHIPIELIRINI
jgi:hypothetical protein